MTRRNDPKANDPKSEAPEAEVTEPAAEAAVLVDEPFAAEPSKPTPDLIPPAPPPPVPSTPTPSRRSGVLGPLLGGALAAIGGFALSHFNVFGMAASDQSAEVAALAQRLEEIQSGQAKAQDEMAGELGSITTRLATLESAPVPEATDLSRLDDLDQRLAAIETLPAEGVASSTAVTAKLAELERRIAALPATGAAPELQAELDAALARLSDAEAAATARAAEAEAAEVAAKRDRALEALAGAIAAGGPFVTEMQALGEPGVTESLGPFAEAGVRTLTDLQSAFPDSAREALRIAREISTEDGWGDRLLDFLASQTKARPLTPQAGDGPDAVLSRAEFALTEGRVADALSELEPLDPAVKAPLEAWIADAKAHLAAAAALQAARGE